MFEYSDAIRQFIIAHQAEMLEKLRTLVNLEGHFYERARVEAARDWYQRELEAEGFLCSVLSLTPDERAGILVAESGSGKDQKPVLFTGHIDTMHYAGSFGNSAPFYVEDGIAYGPGVYDSKGGLIIALYVIKALNALGLNSRPIKMIITGDEEYDHIDNDAVAIQQEQARGALCDFHMSCGVSDYLITARKSQDTYFIETNADGGHAGNEFWEKTNALHEILPKLSKIVELTDREKDTTVSVTALHSGAHWSSIPSRAEAWLDVRYLDDSEAQRVNHRIHEIASQAIYPGTRTVIKLQQAKQKALQETDNVRTLFDFLNLAAVRCGYLPYRKILWGGVNDSGTIQKAGIPTIDGCGINGKNGHHITEQAIVQSMYDKAIVLAAAIAESDYLERMLDERDAHIPANS